MYKSLKDPIELATAKALFIARAEALHIRPAILQLIKTCDKDAESKQLELVKRQNIAVSELNENLVYSLEHDSRGNCMPTIDNMLRVMRFDDFYRDIQFNLLSGNAERHVVDAYSGIVDVSKWNDVEEAKSRNYLENKYHIFSDAKHNDALRILFDERSYNPVTNMIKSEKWDGEPRCERFLTEWAKAEDSEYVRECSRLIFAGGIWRIMQPGCKMDDVIVLVGKQGSGKSSLVRFLALNDEYFGEIKTVEGDKATEQLSGKWICEIPELSAFSKVKEVESIKAFITRQKDSYRKPYDRNVDDRPRRCVFVGTTNNPQFLTDLTGNRRFYPVEVKSNAYDVFDKEAECRKYIRQCWAEALCRYQTGTMQNFAKRELVSEYQRMQENATLDDWRIGAIRSYLSDQPVGSFVCVKELMSEVCSPDKEYPQNPTPKDSKDIGIIMDKMEGWRRHESTHRTAKYGNQRGWQKVAEDKTEYAFGSDDDERGALPF